MVALCNRADHIYFHAVVRLRLGEEKKEEQTTVVCSSFFPPLISAAADWMSAVLPHMVWP